MRREITKNEKNNKKLGLMYLILGFIMYIPAVIIYGGPVSGFSYDNLGIFFNTGFIAAVLFGIHLVLKETYTGSFKKLIPYVLRSYIPFYFGLGIFGVVAEIVGAIYVIVVITIIGIASASVLHIKNKLLGNNKLKK